jgi:alpha-1,6-mannosyltransferase
VPFLSALAIFVVPMLGKQSSPLLRTDNMRVLNRNKGIGLAVRAYRVTRNRGKILTGDRVRSHRSPLRGTLVLLKRNLLLILAGLGLECEFLAWVFVTDAEAWHLLPIVFFALFSTYVIVLLYVKRILRGRAALAVIAAFAIMFRLSLLSSPPILSTDIYRYYWEGKVIANGFNPYLYPPDAPQLASLRDPVWEVLNLKFLSASYPPFLELVLTLIYVAFHSVFSYKVVFSIVDMALVWVIYLVLRELKFGRENVIVYAWAPLPIIEVSQTGHNDPVVVLMLFVFFLLFLRAKSMLSANVLGLSVVSKLYPIFLAPVLLKRWGKRATTVFLVTVAAFYAPLVPMGLEVFRGLLFAINTSNFNGSIFPALLSLLESTGLFANPGLIVQAITYAVYAGILLWAIFSQHIIMFQKSSVMKMSFILIGALLLLNRSFFPWYVIWIVPFLAFFTSPSWLLLSGTIFLGYVKYDSFPPPSYETVDPQTRLLIDVVQYVPFYILLVCELFRNWRNTRPQLLRSRSTDLEHLRGS